jgi:hypothetical protein
MFACSPGERLLHLAFCTPQDCCYAAALPGFQAEHIARSVAVCVWLTGPCHCDVSCREVSIARPQVVALRRTVCHCCVVGWTGGWSGKGHYGWQAGCSTGGLLLPCTILVLVARAMCQDMCQDAEETLLFVVLASAAPVLVPCKQEAGSWLSRVRWLGRMPPCCGQPERYCG